MIAAPLAESTDPSLIQQSSFEWEVISGKQAILDRKPLLVALAKSCRQDGILDFLDYLIAEPYFSLNFPRFHSWTIPPIFQSLVIQRAKMPKLLIRRKASQVDAAVLVFEYVLHGLGTRCFIPFDGDGYRSVIAPERHRTKVALGAGEVLVKSGAVLALISYMVETPEAVESQPRRTSLLLGSQSRVNKRRLPLATSFDATLAIMSRNTRHNLRRSKDQLTRRFGAVYATSIDISEVEMLELNRDSSFAPPKWVILERFTAARTLEHGVLAGVKAANGVWLSVIGGHREGDTLCLDWQVNRSGLGNVSVATAARTFLIEAEIKMSTTCIRFERGTTHPISRAFQSEQTQDLIFASRLIPTWLIRGLFAGADGGLLPSVLASTSIVWRQ